MNAPELQARLLILDDDRDILNGTGRFFERHGFAVDCATERPAAETLATHNTYQCAIIDIALDVPQGTEGLEMVPFLREHSPGTRIVVLTGSVLTGLPEAAFRHGADAFLSKPQRLADVERVVERLLGLGDQAS